MRGDVEQVGQELPRRQRITLWTAVRPTPVKLGHAVEDVVAWTTWVCLSAKGAVFILISSHAEEDVEELVAERPATGFLAKSSLSASAGQALICDNVG